MIGAYLANQVQAGFLGAIIVGFIAGFVLLQLKRIPLNNKLKALSTYFIIPIGGTFIVSALVVWVIGQPIATFMAFMNEGLQSMAGASKALLGLVLGGMTAFDMGGPINKVTTLFAQTQVGTQPWLMGGVGVAICVPPLGMALATFLAPKKYTPEEKKRVKLPASWVVSVSLKVRFHLRRMIQLCVIPAIVAGGAVGNIIAFLAGVLNHAPWGGLIVLPVVEGRFMYVIAVIAGAVTTAFVVNFMKKPIEDKVEEQKEETEELKLSFD